MARLAQKALFMNKKYRMKSLVWLLLTGVMLLSAPCPTRAQQARRPAPRLPGIIFILADDLGYGDLGCYGQTMIKTPNIDKLAEEGMKFTDFYAGDTVCAPSRCTLMTGLHTGHARIRSNGEIPLKPEDVTVAEVLKQAYVVGEKGYRTCALGKWGLGEMGSTGTPGKKGFDEWFGYLNQVDAHNYYPTILNRFDGQRPPGQQETQRQISENLGGKQGKYSNDLFTEAALEIFGLQQAGMEQPLSSILSLPGIHNSPCEQ